MLVWNWCWIRPLCDAPSLFSFSPTFISQHQTHHVLEMDKRRPGELTLGFFLLLLEFNVAIWYFTYLRIEIKIDLY